MTDAEVKALENVIEEMENFLRADYDNYTSQFITSKSFDEYCEVWYSSLLKDLETLRDLLIK